MLTRERILHLLHVDLEAGKLYWKNHYQRPDLIGCEAGSINQGYRRLAIDGVQYYSCQIIWFVARRTWPHFTIDHKDEDKLNDSIYNLRKASKGQNIANSGINVRNTSGYKGVSWSAGKWRADIRVNGKGIYLGRYNTPEEAHNAWYKAACDAWGKEFVRAS